MRRETRFRTRIALVAVAAVSSAAVAGCGGSAVGDSGGSSGAADGETQVVRIGTQKVTADAGMFIADRLGYFEDEGIDVEYVQLKDAPTITNLLATGGLEVAGASLAPGIFTSVSQGLGLKLVGDRQSMSPGVSSTRLAVTPAFDKGNIGDTLQALKGKRVAVHSLLSIQLFMLDNLAKQHGMSLADFELVPITSPDQPAAFAGGSIDAAVMLEPYYTDSIEKGLAAPASDMTEGVDPAGETLTGLIYGKEFAKDAALGEAFMVAYMKGVRTYNDAMFHGQDTEEIQKIIAEESDTPLELIQKTSPSGLDPNQNLDPAYIAELQDFYLQQGSLKEEADIDELIDTSFAEKARAELGEYKAPA
jgi:ABC-type nitrate/sulfonate/bicarbonate transport system substrate-binding protein